MLHRHVRDIHDGRRFRHTIGRRARLLPDLRPTLGGGFSLPRMAENCHFLEVCPTARHARHVFRRIEGEARVVCGVRGGRRLGPGLGGRDGVKFALKALFLKNMSGSRADGKKAMFINGLSLPDMCFVCRADVGHVGQKSGRVRVWETST